MVEHYNVLIDFVSKGEGRLEQIKDAEAWFAYNNIDIWGLIVRSLNTEVTSLNLESWLVETEINKVI